MSCAARTSNCTSSSVDSMLHGCVVSICTTSRPAPSSYRFTITQPISPSRGYDELSQDDVEHIHYSGIYPVIGWVLHSLPFIIMARVTYVHHYYPALYFAGETNIEHATMARHDVDIEDLFIAAGNGHSRSFLDPSLRSG